MMRWRLEEQLPHTERQYTFILMGRRSHILLVSQKVTRRSFPRSLYRLNICTLAPVRLVVWAPELPSRPTGDCVGQGPLMFVKHTSSNLTTSKNCEFWSEEVLQGVWVDSMNATTRAWTQDHCFCNSATVEEAMLSGRLTRRSR